MTTALCAMTAASVAAAVDVRTGRIPNALVVMTAGAGFCLTALGWSGSFGAAAAGLMLGGALMLPGHLIGGTGAGDVKLVAALGAVLGPRAIAMTWVYSAIAGGVLACVIAMRRHRLKATLARTANVVARRPAANLEIRLAERNRFALAPAILAGTALALIWG